MRYFPLRSDHFEHDFGVRAVPPDQSILERTFRYHDDVALKSRLLSEDRNNYFQALPESTEVCVEAARMLHHLASTHAPSDEEHAVVATRADENPLLSIARIIQEDVVVLSGDAEAGHPIVAGVVCFPSGWSIAEKVGKSITATHCPVPEYASVLATSTNRLLRGLKIGRPVWRSNWGVRCSDQLDQSPKHARDLQRQLALVTSKNAGERCWFRVERQTLSRLSTSGSILFTIHTHQCPLKQLSAVQRHDLLGVLRSCPDATLQYKGIAPLLEDVVAYLGTSLQNEAKRITDA